MIIVVVSLRLKPIKRDDRRKITIIIYTHIYMPTISQKP